MHRPTVLAQFPWLAPHAAPVDVVMGDDLDAALSAVLFLQTHPQARIVGIYSQYTTVVFAAALAWETVLQGVWLDLDIAQPGVKSVGHHIVRFGPEEELPGQAQHCNVNNLAGRAHANFSEKYPLGTVHFLMWLYDVPMPKGDAGLLLWLADSAYINAQAQYERYVNKAWKKVPGYGWNVDRWLTAEMPVPSLAHALPFVDSERFENRMAEFQAQLSAHGFPPGWGQTRTLRRQLSGYQCQPRPTALAADTARLLDFVARTVGWRSAPAQVAQLDQLTERRSGTRHLCALDEVRAVGLAHFLAQKQVFSYVFQNLKKMNYTSGIG